MIVLNHFENSDKKVDPENGKSNTFRVARNQSNS